MKKIGYIFRFIEEVFFLGLASLVVAMIVFKADFNVIMQSALRCKSFTDYFYAYLFFSLFGYPIVLLLSVLFHKYLDLYNWEKGKHSIIGTLLKTLLDNLTFSFRIIFSFLGVFFDDKDNMTQVGSILMFSLWLINVIFIAVGFIFTFK